MYALIIGIHAIFFFVSHILGYKIFEVIFLLLGLFFLFYFSPLFFLDKKFDKKRDKNEEGTSRFSGIFSQLSIKNSLIIPIILFYIGFYFFLYSIFNLKESLLFLHIIIVITIYSLFFGYGCVFYWKNDIFFETLRFHTLFTLTSTSLLLISNLLSGGGYNILYSLLFAFGILSGLFLLSFTKNEKPFFIIILLSSIIVELLLFWYFFFPNSDRMSYLFITILFSWVIFEVFPFLNIFSPYISPIRYFSVFVVFISLLFVIFLLFSSILTMGVISLITGFFFLISIHIRFVNYISYVVALFLLFFLYSRLFSGLIDSNALFSSFLFIFFLPILLLGITYIIEEGHQYDFIILHYSSILFSIIYSIYSLFFIGWGDSIFMILSLIFFGLSFLLLLSYVRFRKQSIHTHFLG